MSKYLQKEKDIYQFDINAMRFKSKPVHRPIKFNRNVHSRKRKISISTEICSGRPLQRPEGRGGTGVVGVSVASRSQIS